MTTTAYPLTWPTGWKRTANRIGGQFGTSSKSVHGWRSKSPITVAVAAKRLREELERMGVNDDDLVLSTNLKLRLDGLPRSDQAQPTDPGAAVYWEDPWTHQPRCMAIDQYSRVEQNIAALAATIDAMRAIERHGGAMIIERAFTGFVALPAPAAQPDWQIVLELTDFLLPDRDDIERAYRRLASKHHPDRGGDSARMVAVNAAREQALEWVAARR